VYITPALDRKVREPFHESPAARLWQSPAFALLASLAIAALLSLALWLVLRPRGGSLRERLSNYVRADGTDRAGRPSTLTGARTRLLAQASQSLSRASWWPALQEKFDIARIGMPLERALLWTGAGTVAALVALPLIVGPLGVVIAPLVPLVAHLLLTRRVAKERRRFADQLPDNLQVIASAMRAGHSLAGALQVVVQDAPEPAKSELELVIADERMGVPLEDAFATVVRRMDSADLSQVALVAALQRETGGNTAEVIDRVNETMRERLALRRMVSSLTAQGRLSRWVLTAIPVVLLLLLTTINPTYMSPLYTTALGKALLTVGAVMVVSGSMVIKRIVNIKV
jgi:tight adherence protein B